MTQKEYENDIVNKPFIKSVTFHSENGQMKLVDEPNNFSNTNHPIGSIPLQLINALKKTLDKHEINLFENFIRSKECSEKTIKNTTLNSFVKECINKFINSLTDAKEQISEDHDNLEVIYLQSFYGPPVNIMIKLIVDSRLIPFGFSEFNFDINEYMETTEGKFILKSYSEEDNEYFDSIGCSYRFIVSGSKGDLFHQFSFPNVKKDKNIAKAMDILIPPMENNKTNIFWQCLDHFILYEVKLAPCNRLDFSNGKLTPREILDNKTHIVYIARDIDNVVRYIGEGKKDRYLHVNSGVSHVKELNREYFEGRQMSIEIYNDNLSKIESLSIERFLLNKYKKCGLWNSKDYEK